MDCISVDDLFQASAFSKGYIGKHAKGFFTTLPAICASILLYLLNLVMLDYMLLIKGYTELVNLLHLLCAIFLYPLLINCSIGFLE